jgi:hypothetical protein
VEEGGHCSISRERPYTIASAFFERVQPDTCCTLSPHEASYGLSHHFYPSREKRSFHESLTLHIATSLLGASAKKKKNKNKNKGASIYASRTTAAPKLQLKAEQSNTSNTLSLAFQLIPSFAPLPSFIGVLYSLHRRTIDQRR